MIQKIGRGFMKRVVQDGFFVTVLNCAQMLMNGIIKLIYKFCRFIIKYVFLLLDNIVRVIDYPVDMFIKYIIAKTTLVQNNKIMFLTFQGDYTCNPKMIAEEIIKQDLDWELVWDVKTALPTSDYPLGLHFVKHNTLEFYKELASAKVIIENTNIV